MGTYYNFTLACAEKDGMFFNQWDKEYREIEKALGAVNFVEERKWRSVYHDVRAVSKQFPNIIIVVVGEPEYELENGICEAVLNGEDIDTDGAEFKRRFGHLFE